MLFLVLCICNADAKNYLSDPNSFMKETQVDSLYSTYIDQETTERNAAIVINYYEKKIDDNEYLSSNDYKRIGLSYGFLGKAPKAKVYLEKYIKGTYDITILDNNSLRNIKESEELKSLVISYKPTIDGWILFFFSTGLIGIFIAIVLNLRKQGDTIANLLISSFVLLHSLFVIYVCLFASNYIYEFPNTLRITTSFSLLYGPLLYFYFKRISEKYEFKLVDLFHLTPTLLLLLVFMPIYLSSYDQKLYLLFNKDELLQNNLNITILLKSSSLVIYGYLIYRIYKKSLKREQKLNREILKWKKNILVLNSIYVISYLIYGAALFNMTTDVFRYPVIFILCVIVLYVAYTAYVQPRVFSKRYLFAEELLKYKKSGLTENFSRDLKLQLLLLLNEEKIYKMNTINLELLSEKLGTTRHNISQVINEHFDINFFNLINKYRIQEAQRIFKEDAHHNLNIIDVAYDVGFNNKVTFNKAFKEETDLTPTQYIKKISGINLATSA